MSCEYTQAFLEQKFEEGLDLGMTDEQAEEYARESLDQYE